MPKKPPRPTPDQLLAAMAMPDYKSATRRQIFEHYCYYIPVLAEIPILKQALRHSDFVVVRAAAQSIAKLGPSAKDLAFDLYQAAMQPDPVLVLPQAYCEALDALVSIGGDEKMILELVQSHFGRTNWGFLKHSVHALRRLASPKAHNLLSRIVVFAWPDLDKQQQGYFQKHFADFVPKIEA
jgi:hypothetical protein